MRRVAISGSRQSQRSDLSTCIGSTVGKKRRSSAGVRTICTSAPAAKVATAWSTAARLRCRQVKGHHQKSARSRDRHAARQAQRVIEKSRIKTVSAFPSRAAGASWGPRSPSIIHRSEAASASSCCAFIHSSRGIGARPGRQKCLSSSITGSPVIWPRSTAAVDLPAPPRPITGVLVLGQGIALTAPSAQSGAPRGRSTETSRLPFACGPSGTLVVEEELADGA